MLNGFPKKKLQATTIVPFSQAYFGKSMIYLSKCPLYNKHMQDIQLVYDGTSWALQKNCHNRHITTMHFPIRFTGVTKSTKLLKPTENTLPINKEIF